VKVTNRGYYYSGGDGAYAPGAYRCIAEERDDADQLAPHGLVSSLFARSVRSTACARTRGCDWVVLVGTEFGGRATRPVSGVGDADRAAQVWVFHDSMSRASQACAELERDVREMDAVVLESGMWSPLIAADGDHSEMPARARDGDVDLHAARCSCRRCHLGWNLTQVLVGIGVDEHVTATHPCRTTLATQLRVRSATVHTFHMGQRVCSVCMATKPNAAIVEVQLTQSDAVVDVLCPTPCTD
jgi:hypothetical protein